MASFSAIFSPMYHISGIVRESKCLWISRVLVHSRTFSCIISYKILTKSLHSPKFSHEHCDNRHIAKVFFDK